MSQSTLPDVSTTLGPLFLATVVTCVLFGILTLQAYLYLNAFPKDRWECKLSVFMLWALGAMQAVCQARVGYGFMVVHFGNVFALLTPSLSVKVGAAVTLLSIPFVQTFYAIRLWSLSKDRIVPSFVTLVVTLCWVGMTVLTTKLEEVRSVFTTNGLPSWMHAVMASITLADFGIAAVLVRLLVRERWHVSDKRSFIQTLAIAVFGTGALSCILALAAEISFAVRPRSMVFGAIIAILPSIHANSYLALLNARQRAPDDESSIALSTRNTRRHTLSTIPVHVQADQQQRHSVLFRQAVDAEAYGDELAPPAPRRYGYGTKEDDRDPRLSESMTSLSFRAIPPRTRMTSSMASDAEQKVAREEWRVEEEDVNRNPPRAV